MKHRFRIRALDVAAVAAALLVTGLTAWKAAGRGFGQGGGYLVIESQGGEQVYPLGTDAQYPVQGPLGTTVIAVSGGAAYFADSPCPNKTCVGSRPVSQDGDWAACLPNQVLIRAESQGHALDAIAD